MGMEARDVTVLALRLLGLFCLIRALPYAGELMTAYAIWLSMSEEGPDLLYVLSMLWPAIALLGVGLALLLGAQGIAPWLTPGEPEAMVSLRHSAQRLQAVALSVVGVLLVGFAIPRLFQTIGQLIYYQSGANPHVADSEVERLVRDSWLELTGGGLQLALGVGLFLGARGLSRAWHRLRTAGTESVEVNHRARGGE